MADALLASYALIFRPSRRAGPVDAIHAETLELNWMAKGYELVSEHAKRGSPFGQGECSIVAPNRVHSSWTADSPALFHNVHLRQEALNALYEEMEVRAPTWPEAPFRFSRAHVSLLDQLREEMSSSPKAGQSLLVDAVAVQLVVLLIRELEGDSWRLTRDARHRSRKMTTIAEMIRANPSEGYGLETLAAMAGMTRFHFLRAFRRRFGSTPHQFVIEERVRWAAQLLRSDNQSVTEIAFAAGFASSSHFAEAFRRHYGQSPSQYRKTVARRR